MEIFETKPDPVEGFTGSEVKRNSSSAYIARSGNGYSGRMILNGRMYKTRTRKTYDEALAELNAYRQSLGLDSVTAYERKKSHKRRPPSPTTEQLGKRAPSAPPAPPWDRA